MPQSSSKSFVGAVHVIRRIRFFSPFLLEMLCYWSVCIYIYGMTSLDLILLWFGFFPSSVIIVVCICSFSLTTKFSYLNLLTMDDILTSSPHSFDFEKLQTYKKNWNNSNVYIHEPFTWIHQLLTVCHILYIILYVISYILF